MKRLLKVLSVNIIIFAGLILMFEIGLRLFWKMSTLKKEIYQSSPDRTLRYELKPNTHNKFEGFDVLINSDGFRGREYSLRKEKNTYRIVLLGDSVAFGRLMPFEHGLSNRLEIALKNFCPQKNFEVLNMGVEGYNSIQELEMLKTKGLKYNPDLVIVYYSFNDPDYPEYYFKKNFLNRHSMLARYISYKIKKYMVKRDRIRKNIKSIPDNFRYLYSTESWKFAKNALLEMGDLTAKEKIKMVLLIGLELSEPVIDFREGFPFWHIIDILERIKHDNIIVITPIREFSRRNLNKSELTVWSYPDLKANDIIAEYTVKKLQENNIDLCN